MPKLEGSEPSWPPAAKAWGGSEQTNAAAANIKLCEGCRMSICWEDTALCVGCTAGVKKPLPSNFLSQLRDELARSDTTVVVRWLDGRGRVAHHGQVERAPGCSDRSRRADMCSTLALYVLKNGWAAWALDRAVRELRETAGKRGVAASAYKRQWPIEDDAGPITHWCSCGNRKLESSGQAQSLSIEVAIGALTRQPKASRSRPKASAERPGASSRYPKPLSNQSRVSKSQPKRPIRQLRSATRQLRSSAGHADDGDDDAAPSKEPEPEPETAVYKHAPTGEQLDWAYERGVWAGATPQIFADALWLAGPGRRQIEKASGKASREVAKGGRGSVETVLLHYFFMNNHVSTLDDGLELTVLGTYLAALDHGLVRDSDFAPYARDVARHASLGRWVIATMELVRKWPAILDWHAGCLSTLGLMRGLELRAWVYASHWDIVMHYELGSGADWEEALPSWLYVASALGHDAGDLCSDTRMGCADNSYFAVGATAGYEGVAACMDIVCDALEAVVLRDTRGAIDIGAVAGSACATFERTGGELCACPNTTSSHSCEATSVLASVCGDRRIRAGDAASLLSMRDAVRRRCRDLPRFKGPRDMSHLDHEEREQVYGDALAALAIGSSNSQHAHTRLQVAYSSAAQAMCGQLRRRAAHLRRCVGPGEDVLDLSNDCLCGGECSMW
ncbi:hypothetical protein TARUN_8302 [Trichoderma arundinaceum]|uniref:Uncharacterized protein n=1 Tax=Trichoderma arundinaceum TaxID=490622 RepID=A0A395NDH9_TRIAR|nr:hypothetical protein TARUN_8302 [Trichoderma arundinaceum]